MGWTRYLHVEHAAEVCDRNGPTGRFVIVTRGEIQDHGGNVLFRGTAAECVRARIGWRVPTVLVPTETREPADGEVSGADNTWSYTSN